MKAKILTNDPSLITMFRLGSIEGSFADDYQKAKDEFAKACKEDDLAVLIITKSTEKLIAKEIDAHRLSENMPLIVIIDG